jgi:hypothetical protein
MGPPDALARKAGRSVGAMVKKKLNQFKKPPEEPNWRWRSDMSSLSRDEGNLAVHVQDEKRNKDNSLVVSGPLLLAVSPGSK